MREFQKSPTLNDYGSAPMILNQRASKISLSDLLALIENEIAEGKLIEYKETLPGNSDADKREFLADVSSFANAEGGHLIFGGKERRANGSTTGILEALSGLPGISTDVEINRLGQIIRTGLDPKV